MRIWGILVTSAIAATVLVGCASSDSERELADSGVSEDVELVASTVPIDSIPLFLETPQDDADLLPDGVAEKLNLDPASARFQGEWEGRLVYLAVQGTYGAKLVTNDPDDDSAWGSNGTEGNAVLGLSNDDAGVSLQYVPQGTATVPDGWTALSDFIITK